MSASFGQRKRLLGLSAGLVAAFVLVASAAVVTAAPTSPARSTPSGGSSTDQWAFGGNETTSYSCVTANCTAFDGNGTTVYSISIHLSVRWVVIYSETNVSATQTEIQGKAAIGVSASYAFSACIANGTAPCNSDSFSASLAGSEVSEGSTNVTPGTVNLTAGAGAPSRVAALAVSNAGSHVAFNLSGSLSISEPSIGSESLSFDLGASEASTVTFTPSLGIVPVSPATGDAWTASSAFSGLGTYKGGYSVSAGVDSVSNWSKSIKVPASGTLTANGTDLGPVVLYDNYTKPAKTITAQVISIAFGSGNYSATDGWIFFPTAVYTDALGLGSLVSAPSGPVPLAGVPSSSVIATSAETADYAGSSGFVGSSDTGSNALPNGTYGSLSVKLHAGPEPVSVANGQYSAITAGPASTPFPLLLVLGIAAAVIVVVGVGLYAWRRSARRRPPVTQYQMPPGAGSPPTGPGTGSA